MSSPEQWAQLKTIFGAALELRGGARAAYVAEACGEDAALRRQIETLLASHEAAATFLETPVAAPMRDDPTGRVAGSYRIGERLGAGGMGEVFHAHDTKLDRPVALKLLPADVAADPERLRRFHAEARAVSSLNHPHIVSIYDFGELDGRPFIVTELVEGQTVRQKLDDGPLTVADASGIATQVASALSAAHARGIVHRDIKPENVMVRPDGYVKVLDFGLAKLADGGSPKAPQLHTMTGVVMGTPRYMSPEQALGRPVDTRSDVFSCGALLYEMVTGQPAFTASTTGGILDAVLHHSPPAATTLNPAVPAELSRVIEKALAKEPAARYPGAAELLVDLANLRSGTGVTMAPGRRRRRLLAWAVTAIVVSVGAVTVWRSVRHRPEPLTSRDALLLADFTNTTGDPVFDETLKTALAVHLEQSPFLRIVSDDRVRESLRLMERPADSPITSAVGREICQREGAKALLAGSISALGRAYVIALEALDCRTGDTVAREQMEAPGKEQVLAGLGRIATALRGRLGESLASVQQYDTPLERATTSSLDALKAFSTGEALMRTGGTANTLPAIPFLRRAIELDRDFALAYWRLARLHRNHGELDLGRLYGTEAFNRRARVSDAEKLAIESDYYFVNEEIEKAAQVTDVWKQTYANDWRPANMAALLALHLGRLDEALLHIREAARRDPNNALVVDNLLSLHLRLNRLDDAKSAADAARERGTLAVNSTSLYRVAVLTGDTAAARRVEESRGNAPAMRVWRAVVAASLGQFRRARELAPRSPDSTGAGRTRALSLMMEASQDALVGRPAAARLAITEALALDGSRERLTGLVLPAALVDERSRAEHMIAALAREYPSATLIQRMLLPTARAALALRQGSAAEALDHLKTVVPYDESLTSFSPTNPGRPGVAPLHFYLRGQAYLKAQAPGDAVKEFRRITDNHLRFAFDVLVPLAHVGLGRAHAAAGDPIKAREAYARFFEIWKDADPDIPILIEARREFANLPAASTPAADPGSQRRLVVLPFENVTRDSADDWLAAGFSDALSFGLQNVADLVLVDRERIAELYRAQGVQDARALDQKVISRLSQQLGVRYYVHGSFQRVGDTIKVVSRLVDAASGEIKAQESVTDRFANVLQVEDDLARRLAASFAAGTVPRRATVGSKSLEAYQALTEARTLYAYSQFAAAVARAERAVAIDPQYAEAWALLGKAHARSASVASFSPTSIDTARSASVRAAERAVALAPDFPDAHVALALASRANGGVDAWRRAARRAIDLAPRVAEPYTLVADSYSASPTSGCGRDRDPSLAVEYYRKAIAIDPRNGTAYNNLAGHFGWREEIESSIRASDEGLTRLPDHPLIRRRHVLSLVYRGRATEADATFRSIIRGEPTGSERMLLGVVQAALGRTAEAVENFERAIRAVPLSANALWAAQAFARHNAPEFAVKYLQQAVSIEPACAGFIAQAPSFRSLQSHPAVRAVVR